MDLSILLLFKLIFFVVAKDAPEGLTACTVTSYSADLFQPTVV